MSRSLRSEPGHPMSPQDSNMTNNAPAQEPAKRLHFALVGAPNAGKSTLFHALTRARTKIANFPGVTVDVVRGEVKLPDQTLDISDLPGAYSLDPISPDEEISARFIRGELTKSRRPDAVMVVIDATTLSRSFPLVFEVLALGLPTLLVLTMTDELQARGGGIQTGILSRKLGIPVVGVVGHRGIGVDELKGFLSKPEDWPRTSLDPGATPEERFSLGDTILSECLTEPRKKNTSTDRLDRILLHRILGPIIFFALMFVFFQAMFSWAEAPMSWLESLIGLIADGVNAVVPSGFLRSLLVDGVIAGVGGVIVFIPQIALVLLMIHFLEGVGYMARAAFAVDRLMGWMGLEGRCFVSLLSSYACAIPGIMATRSVPDPRSRLATILVAPFMTCSARLPVYTLLISGFVPDKQFFGIVNLRGTVFFSLYLLGAVSAVLAAAVLKRGMIRGKSLPFVMELPPYRLPRISVTLRQVWWGVRAFLKKAGSMILMASIILWVLLSYPKPENMDSVNEDNGTTLAEEASTPTEEPASGVDSESLSRSKVLEGSYAATIGRAIEPALAPLGFDWKIGVGLIGSLAAREVVVATLAQIYAVQEEEEEEEDAPNLAARMAREINPKTGKPVYDLATVLSLLVFFVYSLQCISTLAVMRRETNGYKWPTLAFFSMLAIAYVASLITYQVASRCL